MRKLFIYGLGNVGREVLDIIGRQNLVNPQWSDVGFIDDTKNIESFHGKVILNYNAFCKTYSPETVEVVIAIGEPLARKVLLDKVSSDGYQLANVIDPTAIISPSAQLGKGIIIYPGVFISSDAHIHDNVLIYNHSTVAHDSMIGASSVLSIGVIVAGNSLISNCCFLGAGATIREQIEIGEWSIIAMSSVVCKSAQSEGIYMGNPAKRVKENTSRRVFK